MYLSLIPTADDALSVDHEFHGVAGHVGDGDADQLFGLVYVPHPDVLLRAGCKYFRFSTSRKNNVRDVGSQLKQYYTEASIRVINDTMKLDSHCPSVCTIYTVPKTYSIVLLNV